MISTRNPRRKVHSNSLRYFFFVGGKPHRYTPTPGTPVPFAFCYHGKLRLIYTGYSDAEYFAANPLAHARFTIRTDVEAMWWKLTTREGGEISGDRYDLDLRRNPQGTIGDRLKRRLLRFATVESHMVRRDSTDLVSALS